jgi:glucose/mannose transport system substrate-binding protein
MANQDDNKNENDRNRLLPAWLWAIIWALLGTLCALSIIGLMISPFLWLLWDFAIPDSVAGIPLTNAERTRVAQTGVAQTGTAQVFADQTGTAQASLDLTGTAQALAGQGNGNLSSADLTATAQALASQGNGNLSSADLTATAQALASQNGNLSSTDLTGTAQALASQGNGNLSSADLTATAQALAAQSGNLSSADLTATVQAGAAGSPTTTPTETATPTSTPTPTPTPTLPPPIPPEVPILTSGDTYIIQRDDWLSKLSEKFYADATAYWPIMAATNKARGDDPSYAYIEDPDLIEIGDRLVIPSAEEAQAFMAEFDPTTDIGELFASGPQGQLIVDNIWSSPGERTAANALFRVYRAENPGVELVNANLVNGPLSSYRPRTLNRLAAGNSFDAFLLHAGFEAELYDPDPALMPVNEILDETGLLAALPGNLLALLESGENIYLAPVNIHRGNVIWSNTRLLTQAGIETPTTLEEFFAACDTLRGQGIVPLGMGTEDGFELSHTFEVVLAGTLGAETYPGLWDGSVSWNEPGVSDALTNFSRMLDCANDDRANLSWTDGIYRVINDQAAFSIMGDWAYSDVIINGATDHVTGSPAPGTQGQFLLVSEGFAVPLQAANPANAAEFVRLVSRLDVQAIYNQTKGSLCARSDCDYDAFPLDRQAYFQSTAADFASSILIPMATHGGVPASWQGQFSRIATQFAADRDVATAQVNLILAAEDAGFPQ